MRWAVREMDFIVPRKARCPRSFALELAAQKIRANCIAPGMVRTKMANTAEDAFSAERMKEYEAEYPLGWGEPEDVAYGVVYLLSDASRWMTGTNLVMDGGFICQ